MNTDGDIRVANSLIVFDLGAATRTANAALAIAITKVLAEVRVLNSRPDIDGIVVQMPLPIGVDSDKVRTRSKRPVVRNLLKFSESPGAALSENT